MTDEILDRLRRYGEIIDSLDHIRSERDRLIREARKAGYSLRHIGDALGVSKQRAHELATKGEST